VKIGSKERLATASLLGVICVIALAVWWTYAELDDASRERREASDIARALTDMRLVTDEYALNHSERARAQWYEVSRRVDNLLAASRLAGQTEQELLAGLRDKRTEGQQIFGDLALTPADDRTDASGAELINRRYEVQSLNRLLIFEQDNLGAAFRLSDLATERGNIAERRLFVVVLSGLALIATIKVGVSWSIRRNVLTPVARLQHVAYQVAGGDWGLEFGRGGDDEVGDLTRNLGRMTQSLRHSFARVERSNQELVSLNKELETFSYSVSHDLRGPLRSMDGFSLALLEDYGDKLDEEGKDSLRRIRAASQRMGRLIDDLLGLSHVTRVNLKIEIVNLSEIVREIAAALDHQKNARTVQWLIEENLTARADKNLLGIAMQNLLQNAWKFTGKTPEATIRFGMQRQDGRQAFFVADNGAGFDPDYAAKLFEAFQRLHHADDFPGTGIGLAIVQRIIRRHSGTIWAEAKEGKGATFFFTIGQPEHDNPGQDNPAG